MTREQIEAVWDVFAERGLYIDRASMYYDEGADSEFCETHRQFIEASLKAAVEASVEVRRAVETRAAIGEGELA